MREFHYVVNGINENRTDMTITGWRCVVNCIEAAIEELEISDEVVLWSDPASWPSGSVPQEGEEAEVAPGVNMLFDIDETPLLKKLTINGRLSFMNDSEPHNQTIHTKIMYIRQGELLIGDPEIPYNGNATIILYGEPNDETLAFSLGIEGGNKVFVIVGKAHIYGEKRDQLSRLRETVLKGDQTARVSSGLDWVAGDRLALLPTAT